MFGLDLDRDEWGGVLGIAYLVLRLFVAIGIIAWQFITDAPTSMVVNKKLALVRFVVVPQLTGISVGVMAVCLVSIETGGPRPDLRDSIYMFTGLGGFVLGITLEIVLFMRLFRLSIWVRAFRVPQYRERLQSADSAQRLLAAERLMVWDPARCRREPSYWLRCGMNRPTCARWPRWRSLTRTQTRLRTTTTIPPLLRGQRSPIRIFAFVPSPRASW